jgi:hypothetical protein
MSKHQVVARSKQQWGMTLSDSCVHGWLECVHLFQYESNGVLSDGGYIAIQLLYLCIGFC